MQCQMFMHLIKAGNQADLRKTQKLFQQYRHTSYMRTFLTRISRIHTCSRRMMMRNRVVPKARRIFSSPMPRSFHCCASESKRNSFTRSPNTCATTANKKWASFWGLFAAVLKLVGCCRLTSLPKPKMSTSWQWRPNVSLLCRDQCCMLPKPSSPSRGWLGVKHQVTYSPSPTRVCTDINFEGGAGRGGG